MPNRLTYRGDVTDELAHQATAGRGHVFGPDLCGPRVSRQDAANGIRLGDVRTVEAAKRAPVGASWELVEATYDEDRDVTVALFKPYLDPRQRLRYVGGDFNPDDDHRKLTNADDTITAE